MAGVAVVTGASSGIGKAIYEHLCDLWGNATVIGISRHGPDLVWDLENSDDLPLLRAAVAVKGPVSCLVNCAGILSFHEYAHRIGRAVLGVNFLAPYHLINLFQDDLIATKGSIINIASISGIMPEPEEPIYGASKAALISLTRSMAMRYAPDVRVNSISPGFVKSNLVSGETPQHLIDPIPLGFEADPEDLIPVVDMLLKCRYITGENIVVDGGLSVGKARTQPIHLPNEKQYEYKE